MLLLLLANQILEIASKSSWHSCSMLQQGKGWLYPSVQEFLLAHCSLGTEISQKIYWKEKRYHAGSMLSAGQFFFAEVSYYDFFPLPKYDHFDYLLENVFSYHKWSSGI